MKKILPLTLAALMAVSLCACSSYFVNHLSKEEVMQICLDNQETLLKDIAELDDPQVEEKFQDTIAIDGIMDIGYNSQLVEFNWCRDQDRALRVLLLLRRRPGRPVVLRGHDGRPRRGRRRLVLQPRRGHERSVLLRRADHRRLLLLLRYL